MNKKFLYISFLSVFSINLFSQTIEKTENGNYISLTYGNTGKTYINGDILNKDGLTSDSFNNSVDNKETKYNNQDEYNVNINETFEDNKENEDIVIDTSIKEENSNPKEELPENNVMITEELPKTLKPEINEEIKPEEKYEVQKQEEFKQEENDNSADPMEEENREEKTIFEDNNKKDLKDLNKIKPKITVFNR